MQFSSPTPAIKLSIQRMVCTGCGAEANASCNCGKAYVPKAVRAAEAVAAHPEKSNRQIADEIGADKVIVDRARKKLESAGDMSPPASVTGKDGKQYPAKKTKLAETSAAPETSAERMKQAHGATASERELAEASGDELTPEERLEHYRAGLVIHAEQAADLAEMFAASLKECPTALTDEAIRATYRAVDRWSALLKATAKAARP
jgi:hypothetical protein